MDGKNSLRLLALTTFFGLLTAYRLPNNVIPEHYDLTIKTNMDEKQNFPYDGTVLIQVKIIEETKRIVLHSKGLTINEKNVKLVSLDDQNNVFNVVNVTYDKDVDFLMIDVDKPLKEKSKYELKIPFNGNISDSLVGFYRSSYKNSETGEKEWLAITQFEATYARGAFPCFDEPALKATFSINIERKKGFGTISNMPLTVSMPMDTKGEWFMDKFEKSVPMSTYLVAFMISNFDYVQSPKTDSHVLFKIWARKDAINHTHYASEVGPKVLDYFEKYFSVPYPLPKQDMVAVPDFYSGAMENWGIITYRETALLYKPGVSSTSNKYRVASVIAHELAHQWFGNLVTMKWWTDLWLNEGFATYASTLGLDHIHPEWNVKNEDAADNFVDVFRLDAMNTSHPVSVPIGHPNEIDQIFDVISYKKGSAIIRMMNLFLGEDTFRQGLSNYLKKYKYSNAEQDDLWQSLTEVAHTAKSLPEDITVKQIMDSWTTQSGYPLIIVNRNYEKNSAVVSQTQYHNNIGMVNSSTKKWWVPLSYITKEAPKKDSHPTEWLRQTSNDELSNMPPPDSWVIFNVNMAGLYRVTYDSKNWDLLIDALKKPAHDGIPALNRMQLTIDCMDLAWSGQMDYSQALRLLQYINTEDEYLPWRGAIIGLGRMHTIFKRTPEYGSFKKYMRNLISPVFEKIGGLHNKIVATPDKLDAVKHQVLISSWACRVDVPKCKEHALELFSEWMKQSNPDVNNNIPSDLRSEVYCTGINKGGEAEWEFLWQRYLNTNVASERDLLLRSLGCTSELWLIKRVLEWSISDKSGIRQQDAHSVFDKIGYSDTGYYVAKSFLYEKIASIRQYFKATPQMMGRYIKTIASQISSKSELDDFSKWIDTNKQYLDGANLAIKQALESAEIRLTWKENHIKSVTDILKTINT